MPRVTEQVSSRNEKSLGTGILSSFSAPKLMVVAQEVETFITFRPSSIHCPLALSLVIRDVPVNKSLMKIPLKPLQPTVRTRKSRGQEQSWQPRTKERRGNKPLATEVSQEKSNHRVGGLGPSSLCWSAVHRVQSLVGELQILLAVQ